MCASKYLLVFFPHSLLCLSPYFVVAIADFNPFLVEQWTHNIKAKLDNYKNWVWRFFFVPNFPLFSTVAAFAKKSECKKNLIAQF